MQDLFLDEIDMVRNSLYLTKPGAFDELLQTQVRASIAAELQKLCAVPGVDLRKLCADLTQLVHGLPVVGVTLAFEPTNAFLTQLINMVHGKIANALVNVRVDSTIVAGAIIEIDGKYHDQSVKKKIEEKLEGMRGEIINDQVPMINQ